MGEYVSASDGGHGTVQSVNVLRQLVRVVVEEGDSREIREYKPEDLQFKKMYRKASEEMTDEDREAIAMLEQMEKQDRQEKAEREANQAAEREARQKRMEERAAKKDKVVKAQLNKGEKKGPGVLPEEVDEVKTPDGKEKKHRRRGKNRGGNNQHPADEKKQGKEGDNAKNKETRSNRHGQSSRHNGREYRSHSNKDQQST